MDRNRQVIIDKLNNILTGENMSIKIYARFLKKLPESTGKEKLLEFFKDHQRHAKDLAERIKLLDGTANRGVGVIGIMAANKAGYKNMLEADFNDIVKHLYEGEKMGITISKDVKAGDLDQDSQDLVDRILADDSAHLEVLEKLLH